MYKLFTIIAFSFIGIFIIIVGCKADTLEAQIVPDVNGSLFASGSWATARSATTGSGGASVVGYTGSELTSGNYYIYRGFTTFDTEVVGESGCTASAATLFIHINNVAYNFSDTNTYITIVESTQVSDSSLSSNDFDNVGSVAWSTDKIEMTSTGWVELDLSVAAVAEINFSGYTKIALRSGNDIDNITYAGSNGQYSEPYLDYEGDNAAYLSITYTCASARSDVISIDNSFSSDLTNYNYNSGYSGRGQTITALNTNISKFVIKSGSYYTGTKYTTIKVLLHDSPYTEIGSEQFTFNAVNNSEIEFPFTTPITTSVGVQYDILFYETGSCNDSCISHYGKKIIDGNPYGGGDAVNPGVTESDMWFKVYYDNRISQSIPNPVYSDLSILNFNPVYTRTASSSSVIYYSYNPTYVASTSDYIQIWKNGVDMGTTTILDTGALYLKAKANLTNTSYFLHQSNVVSTDDYVVVGYIASSTRYINGQLYEVAATTTKNYTFKVINVDNTADVQNLINQINATSSSTILGLSPTEMACTANEWSGEWQEQLVCHTKKAILSLAGLFNNLLINATEVNISLMTMVFPFNLASHFQTSWSDSLPTLPADLDYFNIIEGDLYLTIPSEWSGAPQDEAYVVFGEGIFLDDNTAVSNFFTGIRYLSTYVMWGLFIFGILRFGKRVYTDLPL